MSDKEKSYIQHSMDKIKHALECLPEDCGEKIEDFVSEIEWNVQRIEKELSK